MALADARSVIFLQYNINDADALRQHALGSVSKSSISVRTAFMYKSDAVVGPSARTSLSSHQSSSSSSSSSMLLLLLQSDGYSRDPLRLTSLHVKRPETELNENWAWQLEEETQCVAPCRFWTCGVYRPPAFGLVWVSGVDIQGAYTPVVMKIIRDIL